MTREDLKCYNTSMMRNYVQNFHYQTIDKNGVSKCLAQNVSVGDKDFLAFDP